MKKTFADYGIDVGNKTSGQCKILCPECSNGRKKSKDPCLSVNLDKEVWNCWHCGFKGCLMEENTGQSHSSSAIKTKREAYKKPTAQGAVGLSQKARTYFNKRGIIDEVLERNKITDGLEWMPQVQKKVNTIQFPYFKDGKIVNIKFRDGEKNFKLIKDAEQTLYGFDDIKGDTLIWVEGEIDKLSAEVAGFKNCVSVPNGADSKLDFLENCFPALENISIHIIAADDDVKGEKLKTTLLKRIGLKKCKLVKWPLGCKDFNDVLVKNGKEKVQQIIAGAKFCPIEGIISVRNLADGILNLYENGTEGGVKIGFKDLDPLYSIKLGEWTLVSGSPSNGKSEFLDALIIKLARDRGWKFGICSPENQPIEGHVGRLAAKYLEKPFHRGWDDRMSGGELIQCMRLLDQHFEFILPEEEALTVKYILDRADDLVYRKGINGLIIDPWNELDHSRPFSFSETEYISLCLTKIRKFARERNVHIWIMAHPTKLQKTDKGQYPVATPYDVSGSAHWYNKADNCISVWRDVAEPENPEVQIHVQKIRFRENGKHGMATLHYEKSTGTYKDIN